MVFTKFDLNSLRLILKYFMKLRFGNQRAALKIELELQVILLNNFKEQLLVFNLSLEKKVYFMDQANIELNILRLVALMQIKESYFAQMLLLIFDSKFLLNLLNSTQFADLTIFVFRNHSLIFIFLNFSDIQIPVKISIIFLNLIFI